MSQEKTSFFDFIWLYDVFALYLQAETIYEDMKKNLLWMLAAILTCGLMTTSCSSDDNPVGGDQSQAESVVGSSVSIVYLLQK